jgi:polyphosphate kinase
MAVQSEDIQDVPELNTENYINRELSWLEFNRRVLAQARDTSIPLLERVKFLAIFSNNMDEFYMVRVASTLEKAKLGITKARPDGFTPAQLIPEIRRRATDMIREQRGLIQDVLAELEKHGIRIVQMHQLSDEQRRIMRQYFEDEIFPILTPLAVDHARPFPFISNLSLNLAVWVRRDDEPDAPDEFVRLKVPDTISRLIDLGGVMRRYNGDVLRDTFVWLEDLIADNLDMLFPGMHVLEHYPFRVTRNADIDYEQEEEDKFLDISALIEENLRERRFGSVVRLSVPENISPRTLDQLVHKIQVDRDRDIYLIDGALGASGLFELVGMDRPELKYPPYVPKIPDMIGQASDIFSTIRQGDILLHHPYDSFVPVEDFFRSAARDPDVLAIKATLYRVGSKSPIVQALLEARDNDKQVSVLVELKARFDEENNLEWARMLEQKGVHVTYGVEELPMKTHAKIALVVRREADGVRRYVHLGTGNYNSGTARQYTDLGMFTCNREIADDASKLFNRLTGYAPATDYKRLLVAPEYLHERLITLIDNEIAAAQAGKPARLIFKMNQLEEDVMIQKLYQASQAGVKIELIVRGLCCLRPGLPDMSENIRVTSIIGRYLEHSRIFYFQNAPADQCLYLGSADLMRRNLYNRVEVVFPVIDSRVQKRVLRILATCLRDNQRSWELKINGVYERVRPVDNEPVLDSQEMFMKESAGIHDVP